MSREVTDADLLAIDLYADDKDDAGARLTSSRMVTTRKPQVCVYATRHSIPVGTRARVERAIIDGRWCGFYVCRDCLVDWVREWT